ncbi:hypothetical protein F2Q70_00035866 [Brassica cretica]|nr:hypothetical protein F2Q70_00035866 [Brassica cretica]
MVSNLIFPKDQNSKVTKGELQMLYSGLKDEIRKARDIPIQSVNTNTGYHLIWMFYSRRDRLMRVENKSEGRKDRCGSLLTPLFKYFGINLRSYAVNHEIEYIDTPYLIACHILPDVPQPMDQYMEPAQYGDQDVLNNSTMVRPSDRPCSVPDQPAYVQKGPLAVTTTRRPN